MQSSLKGIYLLERGYHNDTFAWGFPTVDQDIVSLIKLRTNFSTIQPTPPYQQAKVTTSNDQAPILNQTICHKFKNNWLYSYITTIPIIEPTSDDIDANKQEMLLKSTHIVLTIVSEQYNLPAISSLLQLLTSNYVSTPNRSTTTILQAYLQANAHGKVEIGTETWDSANFDPRMALIQPTHTIPQRFGLESIIIFIAVLTKRRIIVHHPDPLELSQLVRSLITFGGWHRNTDGLQYLRPINSSILNSSSSSTEMNLEINDIKNTPNCIAGILNKQGIDVYDELWDIFIDGTSNSIELNNTSAKKFTLTKYHKSIADAFMQTVESVSNNTNELECSQLMTKVAMMKVKEILELVNKSKDHSTNLVSMASLQSNGAVPANLHQFIYSVAVAENCATK